MEILGIDEAGRGPVVGPMVICGVLSDEEGVEKLRGMRVRDSKEMNAKARETMRSKIIEAITDFHLDEVQPREIDEAVKYKKLNQLEAEKMKEIIQRFKPEKVFIDAPGINPTGFLTLLKRCLSLETQIIAENFADKKYPIVSAASILAKVRRDEIIQEYHKKYGDFGSGYPSDIKTINFLENYYKKYKNFPEIVRVVWGTKRKLLHKITQTKLERFVENTC